MSFRPVWVAISCIWILFLPARGQAASQTWTGGAADANWSSVLNWNGAVPGSTSTTTSPDIATFSIGIINWGLAGTPIIIDSATQNIGGITFSGTAGSYTLGTVTGNALLLSNNGTVQISSLSSANVIETLNAPLVLQGAASTLGNSSLNTAGTLLVGGGISGVTGTTTLTLTGTNGNANTVSGVISNGSATSLGISKTGSGRWILSGANTYSGGTSITGGVLNIQNGSALGTVGGVTVSSGAALQMQGGITVSGNALTLNGNGIANDGALRSVSGNNAYTGGISLQSSSTISANAGSTLTLGSVALGINSLTFSGAGSMIAGGAITGSGAIIKTGIGTLTFSTASLPNAFGLQGGTAVIDFSSVSSNVLPSNITFTFNAGTLQFSGTGSQTFAGLSLTSTTSGQIVAGAGQTLSFGSLSSAGAPSVNFSLGGGGSVFISGQTSGAVINPAITVTDSTGFGLATVDANGQVIRSTSTQLLPASGAANINYLINNNNGGSSSAGSASLVITASQSVNSVTVDTTAANGVLTLANGAVLSSNLWNIGGVGSNTWQISAGGSIRNFSSGAAMDIINYAAGRVTLYAPIVDNGNNAVNIKGNGTLVLAGGLSNVNGVVTVRGGTLEVTSGAGYIAGSGSLVVGSGNGDLATVNVTGGTVSINSSVIANGIADLGTVNVSSGTWSAGVMAVGSSGTGVVNLTGGNLTSGNTTLGTNATGSGTVNVSGGVWSTTGAITVGSLGSGVLNITGTGTVVAGGNVTLGSSGNGIGTLNLGTGGTAGLLALTSGSVTSTLNTAVINFNHTNTQTYSFGIAGAVNVNKLGSGTSVLTGTGVNAGTTYIGAGTLQIGNGGSSGTLSTSLVSNEGTLAFNRSGTLTQSTDFGLVRGGGSVVQMGPGQVILSGANTYTGATSVLDGLLQVTGSTSGASAVSVSGGALGGTGTVGGAVTLTGSGGIRLANGTVGTLTLGSSLDINNAAGAGTLAFDLASSGSTTDKLAVTGAVGMANTGGGVITLNQIGGAAARLTAGTYDLITGSSVPSAASFTLATTKAWGQTFALSSTSTAVQLTTTRVTSATAAAVWKGGNNNWSSASNWNSSVSGGAAAAGAPDYATNVTFATTTPTPTNLTTNVVDADFDINSLTFNIGTGGVTLGDGGKMLTIEATNTNGNAAGNGITSSNTSGQNVIATNVGLAGAQTWTVSNASGTLAVQGVVSDFGGGYTLTKAGAGTLVLTNANTFTGSLAISGGVVTITNGGALGSALGGTTVATNTVLQLTNNITVASEVLTLSGTGSSNGGALRSLAGNNTWSGAIVLGAATRINSNADTLTLNSPAAITGSFSLSVGGAGNTVITSAIANGGGGLTKDGAGVLTLSGVSSYTGTTTLSQGTLRAGVASVTGLGGAFGNGPITGSSGTTLDLNGFDTTLNTLNTSGAVTLGSGTLTFGSGSSSIGGGISGSGGLTLNLATVTIGGSNTYTGTTFVGYNSSITLSGSLSPASTLVNNGSLTFTRSSGMVQGTDFASTISGYGTVVVNTSAGAVVFNAANTYTGTTTVSTGALVISHGSALGTVDAGTSVSSGGGLYLQGGITTQAEALTLSGLGLSNLGTLKNLSGDNTYTGSITLISNSRISSDSGTLILNNAAGISGSTLAISFAGLGNIAVTGPISLGTGGVSLDGAGTVTLSGSNSYGGATILNSGTLVLAFGQVSSNILPASQITFSGGTLQLTGTGSQSSGSLTVSAGTGSQIVMGANQTLAFTSSSTVTGGALNINTAAGGADATSANPGTGVITINSIGVGTTISPGWTVTDSTGFGLATADASKRIFRQVNTPLLPASSGLGVSYLIDNNSSGPSGPGSSTLQITASQSAASITVDTTARSGAVTLGSGVVLSTDIWNFGGLGSNNWQISSSGGSGSGIMAATGASTLYLNNYAPGRVTLATSILDNNTTAVQVRGPGTLVLTGASNFAGPTGIRGGTVEIASGAMLGSNADFQVGPTGSATLNVTGGYMRGATLYLGNTSGGSGVANISTGSAVLPAAIQVGTGGSGVLNITGGYVQGRTGWTAGSNAGSSAVINVSGGALVAAGGTVTLGSSGSAVLNISSSGLVTSVGGISLGAAGTLNITGSGQLRSNATLSSSAGSVVNLNPDSTLVFATTLSGGLRLNKLGSGTLIFNAFTDNSSTGGVVISGGVLQLGLGGGTGSGLGLNNPITNNGTLAINRVINTTQGTDFSAIISGTGSLVQMGPGTTILSGTSNTYTGATVVQDGLLRVDAGLTSTSGVTVTGGALGGNGIIGAPVTLSGSGGFRLANNTVATLTLASTLAINNAPGAAVLTFDLATGGSSTDKITVGGAVTMANPGAAVISLAQSGGVGNRLIPGTYDLITAASLPDVSSFRLATTKAWGQTFALASTGTSLQVITTQVTSVTPTASWKGGSDNWSTLSNWNTTATSGTTTAGTPDYATAVTFATTSPTPANLATNVVDTDFDISTLTLSPLSGGITIGGAGKMLTIEASGGTGITSSNTSGVNTIATNIGLGASQGWSVSTGGTLVVSGVISDFGGANFTKNGSGTLVLSGANTFTSSFNISTGVVLVQNSSALGSALGSTTVSSGAALQLQGGITIQGENLNINGTGISNNGALRNLSGDNTFGGFLTFTNARINSDAGTLTLSNTSQTAASSSISFGGAGNIVFNAPLYGTGSVSKDGIGTVTMSGLSSYSGTTTVSAGTLRAGVASQPWVSGAFGSTSSVSVSAGAVLDLNNYDTQVGVITGAGTVQLGTATLTLIGTSGTFTGVISGTGGITLNNSSQAFTMGNVGPNTYTGPTTIYAGTLNVGSSYAGSLPMASQIINHSTLNFVRTNVSVQGVDFGSVISGTGAVQVNAGNGGTVVLNGANTYLGSTTVSSGVLNIQSAAALGSIASGTTIGSGATLQIQGGITTQAEALTLNGTGLGGQGVLRNISGDNNYTGPVTASSSIRISSDSGTLTLSNPGVLSVSGLALEFGGAGNIVINSPLGSGAAILIKYGSGTFTLGTAGFTTGGAQVFGGTFALSAASSYSGSTTLGGGVLRLDFGTTTSNIVSAGSALTLNGGTLQMTGTGSQVFSSLTTGTSTGSRVLLGANETLTLNAAPSIGSASAVNFNLAAGGADAVTSTVGSSLVVITGRTAGAVISNGFTVTDSTGFGLATVNASNQVVRLTNTTLLPASGASSSVDYLVDNNAGGTTAVGSSTLALTASQSAGSITVDTTAGSGGLTLGNGVVLSNSVWNIGGIGANTWQISGSAGGAGLKTVSAGTAMEFNLWGTGKVTLAAPILDNAATALNIKGSGSLVLTGANTLTGQVSLRGSTTLELAAGATLGSGATSFSVSGNSGDNATFNLTGGTLTTSASQIGSSSYSTGTVNMTAGTWSAGSFILAGTGTGVLNMSGGVIRTTSATLSSSSGSNSVLNVTGGSVTLGGTTSVGSGGLATVNLSGSGVLNFSTLSAGNYAVLNLGNGDNGWSFFTNSNATVGVGTVMNVNNSGTTQISSSFVGSLILNKTGSGTVILSGSNNLSGTATINAGTLQIGGGGASGSLPTGSALVNNGAFVINRYSSATSGTEFGSVITGTGSLTQAGQGTTNLNGVNTYTGGTQVTAGILAVNGSTAAASSVSVTGGALGGTGSVGGAVALSGSGGINLTGNASTNTLTLGSSLAVNNSAGAALMSFDLANGGTTTDKIAVTGAFTAANAGAVVVSLNQLGGGSFKITPGTYDLITAASMPDISSFTLLTTRAFGQSFALATTPTSLQLLVSTNSVGGTTTAFWRGGSDNWSSLGNWTTTAAGTTYLAAPADMATNVTFASASGAANLATNVVDADFDINSLNISGTAGAVTIGNAGRLLTLEATSANGNASGSGISVSNAGVINTIATNVGLAATQTWTVNAGATLLVSGSITDFGGAYALTKAGGGTLVLSGANTFTNTFTVSVGAVTVANGQALGNTLGGTSVSTGAALQLQGGISITEGLSITGTGTGTGNTGALRNLSGDNTLIGQLSVSGSSRINSDAGTLTLGAQGSVILGSGQILTVGGAGNVVINSAILTTTGGLAKDGSGTLTLTRANLYTGSTTLSGGRLVLALDAAPFGVISSSSGLGLAGGTLQLTGAGIQTFASISASPTTGSQIIMGSNQTLTLGALTTSISAGLSVNLAAGGGTAGSPGSGVVIITGQTAGNVINSGFTVTDSTGFGLATVNSANQVVRLATPNLLPAVGGVVTTDYVVDNNAGGTTAAGSSTLVITASQSARSITVDTSGASGGLTLNSGVVQSANIYNLGGVGSNTWQISNAVGAAAGTGLKATTTSAPIEFNNYAEGRVTLSAPILDNTTTAINVKGSGTLVLAAANTYAGATTVRGGTLEVTMGGSISNANSLTLGSAAGDNGTLSLTGGTVSQSNVSLGSTAGSQGTVNLSSGTLNVSSALTIGSNGAGVFNMSGGAVNLTGGAVVASAGTGMLNMTGGTISSVSTFTVGTSAGASGLVTINGGAMNISGAFTLGSSGAGTMNMISGTVGWGTGSGIGTGGGSSGVVNMSGGTWAMGGTLTLGGGGSGVVNLSGGVVTSGAVTMSSGGGPGVLNMSGGTWTVGAVGTGVLSVGAATGSAVINLTGGTLNNLQASIATTSSGYGVVNVGGGMWNTPYLLVSTAGIGALNISSGTINSAYAAISTGTGTGVVTVSGGTWNQAGNLQVAQSGTGVLTLTGSGVVNVSGVLSLGTVSTAVGTLNLGTGAGAGTLNAALVTSGAANGQVVFNHTGTYTFATPMAGRLGVSKFGSGTTILTSANSFSGNTTINAGVVQLSNARALQNSGVTALVANGLGFDRDIGTFIIGSLSGTAAQALVDTTGSPVTLAVSADTTASSYTGVLSGSGGIQKGGNGTWSLSGANTYTGATSITGGILQVNGSISASSPVSVSGGALAGSGTVGGAVTLSGTGGIQLANASVGTLTLGSTLAINNAPGAALLRFDLASSGTTTDKIAVAGAVTMANPGAAFISLAQSGGVGNRLTPGTYDLITAASIPDFSNFRLETTRAFGQIFALTGTATALQLVTTQVTSLTPTAFWKGGSDNWSTLSNWNTSATSGITTAGTPDHGTAVTFATTSPAATNLATSTVDADFDIASLTFGSTVGGVNVLSAGKMLTIEGFGITSSNTSGVNTIATNIGIASASHTWTVAAGGTLLVSGAVSDFGMGQGFTKSGTGTLVLSGSNTFQGAVNISAGVLNIRSASALGSTLAATTVSSGAVLQIQGSITTLPEGLILNGTGVAGDGALRSISGENNFTGLISLGGNSRINSDSGTLTLSNTGLISSSSSLTFGGSGTVVVYSTLGLGTSGVTKDGTGTLVLAAANTYTGATSLNIGVLRTAVANALGMGSAVTLTSALTILDFNGYDQRIGSLAGVAGSAVTMRGGSLTITGSPATYNGVISGTGGLTLASTATQTLTGTNTYTGDTTIASGTLQLGNASTTGSLYSGGALIVNGTLAISRSNLTVQGVDFGSVISGTGGVSNTSTGTTILNGANTYSGLTTVSSGVLLVQNSSALGSASSGTSVSSGGALHLQGGVSILGEALNLNGNGSLNTGALRSLSGTNTWSGVISLGANSLIQSDAGTLILSNTGAISSSTGSAFSLSFNGAGNILVNSSIALGTGTLTKSGIGTLTLTGASTSTGATTISGTLVLGFGGVSSNIISASSPLTLLNGILQMTGTGTQTFAGVTFSATTANHILLGANQTLNLGTAVLGSTSSLYVNTAAGGANAATSTVGTSMVVISGQTAGNVLSSGYTVADSTGFGLATVNASGQIIRLTNTTLLPASGAVVGTNYLVDNNAGGSTAAGSSTLRITTTETANSITVDTTATSGGLTLASGVVLRSSLWNIGGVGSNTWQISNDTGAAAGTGITAATTASTLVINNYAGGKVTWNSPIVDFSTTALTLRGTGTLALTGANTYTGTTILRGGVLEVATGGSISNSAALTIGQANGDNATLRITGGSVTSGAATLGTTSGGQGTLSVSSGSFSTASNALVVGSGGNGVVNVTGGSITAGSVSIADNATSVSTVNASGGTWTTTGNLWVGNSGTGVLNISGATVTSGSGSLGVTSGATSSGTVNVSSGSWTVSTGSLVVGGSSTGVLNITGGTVTSSAGGATIGSSLTSFGTVNLSSGAWDNGTNSLTVAQNSTMGQLNLSGGALTAGTTSLATAANSTAVVTVSGGTWNNSASISVGAVGTGTLAMTGGTINTASTLIGTSTGSVGVLNISGGSYNNSGNLTVGSIGTATLTIGGNGTVTVGGGTGNVTLANNGGTATLNLAGGTLNASSVTNGFGTGTVNFTQSGTATYGQLFQGTLSATQSGIGTSILTSANTYSGTTTVSSGTLLALNTTGSATGTGSLVVNAGATLGGTGRINSGSNSITINGTLSVGDSTLASPVASSLQVGSTTGGIVLGSSGALRFDLFTGAGQGDNTASVTASDLLVLYGDISLLSGATLLIDNPNNMAAWAIGDQWRLWDVTNAGVRSGNFALGSIIGPMLGNGQAWSFDTNAGVLSIVPEPGRAMLLLLGLLGLLNRRRRN